MIEVGDDPFVSGIAGRETSQVQKNAGVEATGYGHDDSALIAMYGEALPKAGPEGTLRAGAPGGMGRPVSSVSTADRRSGRSVWIPSTPQSRRRRMSSSLFTVQICTGIERRWASRMKRRVTTRSRPRRSGTWKMSA